MSPLTRHRPSSLLDLDLRSCLLDSDDEDYASGSGHLNGVKPLASTAALGEPSSSPSPSPSSSSPLQVLHWGDCSAGVWGVVSTPPSVRHKTYGVYGLEESEGEADDGGPATGEYKEELEVEPAVDMEYGVAPDNHFYDRSAAIGNGDGDGMDMYDGDGEGVDAYGDKAIMGRGYQVPGEQQGGDFIGNFLVELSPSKTWEQAEGLRPEREEETSLDAVFCGAYEAAQEHMAQVSPAGGGALAVVGSSPLDGLGWYKDEAMLEQINQQDRESFRQQLEAEKIVVLRKRILQALDHACSEALPDYDLAEVSRWLSHEALQRDQDHEVVKRAKGILQEASQLLTKLRVWKQDYTLRMSPADRRQVARMILPYMEDPKRPRIEAKLSRHPEVMWYTRFKPELVEAAKEPPPPPVTAAPRPPAPAPTPAHTPAPQPPAPPAPTSSSLLPPPSQSAALPYDNSQDQYLAEAGRLVKALEQLKARVKDPNVGTAGPNRLSEDPRNNADWRKDAFELLYKSPTDLQARIFHFYTATMIEKKALPPPPPPPNSDGETRAPAGPKRSMCLAFTDGVESLLVFSLNFARTRTSEEQLTLADIFRGVLHELLPHTIPELSLNPATSAIYKKLDSAAYSSAPKDQVLKLLETYQVQMRAMGMACNLVMNAGLWAQWSQKIGSYRGGPTVTSAVPQAFPVQHDTAWKWLARYTNDLKVDQRPLGEVLVAFKMLEAFIDETGRAFLQAYPTSFLKLLRCIRRDLYGKFVERLSKLTKLDMERWEASLFVNSFKATSPLEMHPPLWVDHFQVPAAFRICEQPGCPVRGKRVAYIRKNDDLCVPSFCETHKDMGEKYEEKLLAEFDALKAKLKLGKAWLRKKK